MNLFVADAEINLLLPRFVPPDLPVEDLRLRITPDGVVIHGVYPALGFRVSFEMLWELTVLPGEVEAHLRDLSVAGFGAGKLRGLLLKMVRDAVGNVPGVRVEDDRVSVNPAELLRAHGAPVSVEIVAVRCMNAVVEIEARVQV
jgi:hypothetical protein